MTISTNKAIQSHNDVLEAIAEELDIPPSAEEAARSRYDSIGKWLDREGSELRRYGPKVSPQGSFLLGTVVRPVDEEVGYDVDLVCKLSKATKQDFTQRQLKETVGKAVKSYQQSHGLKSPVEEGQRCWTLHYADEVSFHLDVLPAVPDEDGYRNSLLKNGHTELAKNGAWAEHGIAITDRTDENYDKLSDRWPLSNPQGYAAWFRSRMMVQLEAQRLALAKRKVPQAQVDDIPDSEIKTPLQRAIQLLKRHRDMMFADDGEHKPISIIITTLAVQSYKNQDSIVAALKSILDEMEGHIKQKDGVDWIANPINPDENFADKWPEHPVRKENFLRWLDQARKDFLEYFQQADYTVMPQALRNHLGSDLLKRVLAAAAVTTVAAPAVGGTSNDDIPHVDIKKPVPTHGGNHDK